MERHLDDYQILVDFQSYLNEDNVNYDVALETISMFEDLIKDEHFFDAIERNLDCMLCVLEFLTKKPAAVADDESSYYNYRKRCIEVLCVMPLTNHATIYVELMVEKLKNLILKENFHNVILCVKLVKDLIKYYQPFIDTNDFIEQMMNYFCVILDFYRENLHLNCETLSLDSINELKQKLLSKNNSVLDDHFVSPDNIQSPYVTFDFFNENAIYEILSLIGVVFQVYSIHIQGVSTSILNYFRDVIRLTPDIAYENFFGVITSTSFKDFIKLQLRIATLYCVLRKKDWMSDEIDSNGGSQIDSVDTDLSRYTVYMCILCSLKENFQTMGLLYRLSQLVHFESLFCGEASWVEQLFTDKGMTVSANNHQPLHVRQFIYNISVNVAITYSSKLQQSSLAIIFESMIHGLYEKDATPAFLKLCVRKSQLTERAFVAICKKIEWLAYLNDEHIKSLIEMEQDGCLDIDINTCKMDEISFYIWLLFDDKYERNNKMGLTDLIKVLFVGARTMVTSPHFPNWSNSPTNSHSLTNAVFDCQPRSRYHLFDILLKSTFRLIEHKLSILPAEMVRIVSSSTSTIPGNLSCPSTMPPIRKSMRGTIDNLTHILCSMDSCAYIDVMTTNIDSIFKLIDDTSPVLSLLNGLINNASVSVTTVSILLQYIIVTVRNREISTVLRTSFSCMIKSIITTANLTPTNEAIICCYFPTLLREISNLSLCAIKNLPQQKSVMTNYFFIIRTIFLCIGSTPNENVYQAMLPYMTSFALRLVNIAMEMEKYPPLVDFKLIVYELCVTIPMKLFHLVPHANSLVSVLIKCLSTFSDILVFQALRTLVMILESIHAPHLEETIGQNKHSLVQVLISLHQRKNAEITKLANRAISSLGSLARMFVDSLNLTQSSDVAIESSFYRNKNDLTNIAYGYRLSKYCVSPNYDNSLAIQLRLSSNPEDSLSLNVEFKLEKLLLSSMQFFSHYAQPLLQHMSGDPPLFEDVWQMITDIQNFVRYMGIVIIGSIDINRNDLSRENQTIKSLILTTDSRIRLLGLVCRIYASMVLFCMNNIVSLATREILCNECFYFLGQLCRVCSSATAYPNTPTNEQQFGDNSLKHIVENRLKIVWALIKYVIESYSALTSKQYERSKYLGKMLVVFIVGSLGKELSSTPQITNYLPKLLLQCVESSDTDSCVKIELLDMYLLALPPDNRSHVIDMYINSYIPFAVSLTTKTTCDLDYYKQSLVKKILTTTLNKLCDIVNENVSSVELVSSIMVTVPNTLWRFILSSFELVEQCLKLMVNRFPLITMKDLLIGSVSSIDTLLECSVFATDMDATSFSYLSNIQKIFMLRVSVFLCENDIVNDDIRNRMDFMYLVEMTKFLRQENDFHASPAKSFINCSLLPNYDPLEQGAMVTDIPTFYTDEDILDVLVDFLLLFVDHEKYDMQIARILLSIIDNLDGKISNKVINFFHHQLPSLKIQPTVMELITSHLKTAVHQADLMNHAFVKKLKCLYFANPLLGDKEIIEHILQSTIYVVSSFVNNKRSDNVAKLASCSLFEEQFLWYEVIDIYLAFNVSTIVDMDFLLSTLVEVEQKLRVILHYKFYTRFADFFTLPSNLPVYLSLFKSHIKEPDYSWFMVRVMRAEKTNTLAKHLVDDCFNYICVIDFSQLTTPPTITSWNNANTQSDDPQDVKEWIYLLSPFSLVLIKELICKCGQYFSSQQPVLWDLILQTIYQTTPHGVLSCHQLADIPLLPTDDLQQYYIGLLYGVVSEYVAASITRHNIDSYYLYVLVFLDYMNSSNTYNLHGFLNEHLFPTLTAYKVYNLVIDLVDWAIKLSNDHTSGGSCNQMFFGSDFHIYWITKKLLLPILHHNNFAPAAETNAISPIYSSVINSQSNSSVLGFLVEWLSSQNNRTLTSQSLTFRTAIVLLVESLVCAPNGYLQINAIERDNIGRNSLEFCIIVHEGLKSETSSSRSHHFNLADPLNEVLSALANLVVLFCVDTDHLLHHIQYILTSATNYNYNVVTKGLSLILNKFVELSPKPDQIRCLHTQIISYYRRHCRAMDTVTLVPIKLILYMWVDYQQKLFSSCETNLLFTLNSCISKMISQTNTHKLCTVVVVEALRYFFKHIIDLSSSGRAVHSDFSSEYQINNFLYLVKYMCTTSNLVPDNKPVIVINKGKNSATNDSAYNSLSMGVSSTAKRISDVYYKSKLFNENVLFEMGGQLKECYDVALLLIKNMGYLENGLLCERLHAYFFMLILSQTSNAESHELFIDFITFYVNNVSLINFSKLVNHIASTLIEKINTNTTSSAEFNTIYNLGATSPDILIRGDCLENLMSAILSCDHTYDVLNKSIDNDDNVSTCYNILDGILKSNLIKICEVCQEDRFALLTGSQLRLWNSLIPHYTSDQLITMNQNLNEYLPKCKSLPCRQILSLFIETCSTLILHTIRATTTNLPSNLFSCFVSLLQLITNIKLYFIVLFSMVKLVRSSIEQLICCEVKQPPADLVDLIFECLYAMHLHCSYDHNLLTEVWKLFFEFYEYMFGDNLKSERVLCSVALGSICLVQDVRDRCRSLLLDHLHISDHTDNAGRIIDQILSSAKLINNVNTNSIQLWLMFVCEGFKNLYVGFLPNCKLEDMLSSPSQSGLSFHQQSQQDAPLMVSSVLNQEDGSLYTQLLNYISCIIIDEEDINPSDAKIDSHNFNDFIQNIFLNSAECDNAKYLSGKVCQLRESLQGFLQSLSLLNPLFAQSTFIEVFPVLWDFYYNQELQPTFDSELEKFMLDPAHIHYECTTYNDNCFGVVSESCFSSNFNFESPKLSAVHYEMSTSSKRSYIDINTFSYVHSQLLQSKSALSCMLEATMNFTNRPILTPYIVAYIGKSHFCNFASFIYLENHINGLKQIEGSYKTDDLELFESDSTVDSNTNPPKTGNSNEAYQEILNEIDKSRKSLISLISPHTNCNDLQYGVYSASGYSRRLLDPLTFSLHGEHDIALTYYENVLRNSNPMDDSHDPTEERLLLNGFLDCCKALGSWDLLTEINKNQLKQPKCERMIGLNMLLENSWKFGDWPTLKNIFKLVDQDESLCNDAFSLNYIRTIYLLNKGVLDFSDKTWMVTGETHLLTAIKTVVNQLRRYPLQVATVNLSPMVNLQKVSEIADIFDFYRNNFDTIKSISVGSSYSVPSETPTNRPNITTSTLPHNPSNNQLIVDLKTIARGWNIRCYRYIDDICSYNDIMNQRCLTFLSLSSIFIKDKLTQSVSQSTALPAAFSYIPPETPSSQPSPQVNSVLQVCYQCTQISCLHFATSLRRSGIYSSSISTLSNIQNNDGASNSIIIFIQKVIQLCKNLIELYDINGNEALLEEAISVLDVVNNKVVSKDQLSKLYVIRSQVYDRQKKYNKSSSTLEEALHLNESYQAWSTWGGFLYDLYVISESDDVEIANELISCYLSAAQFSKEIVSGRALSRALHVFGENLSVQQICDTFQNACELVPSNYWVNWIPHIITLYSYAKMNIVMASLINNLTLNFPQALIPHIVPYFDELKDAAYNSAKSHSKSLDQLRLNTYQLFFERNKEVPFESSTVNTLPHHQLATNNVYNLLKSILDNHPNTISYLLAFISYIEKITRKTYYHDIINCLFDIIALVIDNRKKFSSTCDSPSIEEGKQNSNFESFRLQLFRHLNYFHDCLKKCVHLLDSVQYDRLNMILKTFTQTNLATIIDVEQHLELLIRAYLEMKKVYKNHAFSFTTLSNEFEENNDTTAYLFSFHKMSYFLLTNMESTEILYPFTYIETPYNIQLPYPRISMILPKLKLKSGFKGKLWPSITCVMMNGVVHRSLLVKQNEQSQDGRNLQKFARIRYWVNLALKKSADCSKRSLRIAPSQHVVMTSRSTYMLHYLDNTTFLCDFPEESTVDDNLMTIILWHIQKGIVDVENVPYSENYFWRLLSKKFFSIEVMWEFRQKFIKSWIIHSLLQKIFLLSSPTPFEMSTCFKSGEVNFYPTQDLFHKKLMTGGYKQCPRIRFTPHLKAFIGENNVLGTIHQSIIALAKCFITEKYSFISVLKCELNESEFRQKKLNPIPIQSLVELTTKCRRQNNRVCWHTRLSCEEYCSFSNNHIENIQMLFNTSDLSLKSPQDINDINPLWCYWF